MIIIYHPTGTYVPMKQVDNFNFIVPVLVLVILELIVPVLVRICTGSNYDNLIPKIHFIRCTSKDHVNNQVMRFVILLRDAYVSFQNMGSVGPILR